MRSPRGWVWGKERRCATTSPSYTWEKGRSLMSDGRVTYACEAGWNVLRYFGRVDYTMAPAIERFIDGLGQDVARPFLFDLAGARLLDSTNLGLMARVVARSRAAGAGRSLIVSPPD